MNGDNCFRKRSALLDLLGSGLTEFARRRGDSDEAEKRKNKTRNENVNSLGGPHVIPGTMLKT